ncbi:hypothetical protein [Gymnodinialimonas ulvae]|uniref:hypothetical protein n=1 Tax=Gymnodinialimonas ulvae TaxID=3126504 RepID=UPI0030AD824F
MFRFTIATAATALLLSPAFAQTTTETAEEILNDSADTVLEETDATPVEGAPDCDNPTAEEANDDADTATDEIECPSAVSGEPDAGEEEFERLEEEDDEGVEIDE